ncbi:MAG: hypothetical protein LBH53_03665 [Puniceicoccales bacterium]|jgi:hypothetical protein|nr:hypothetical protein [Puniceicoccales bacterium]
MLTPTQISYRHDVLTTVDTVEAKRGTVAVILEMIVNADGSYNATRYNTQTDSEEMLSGRADGHFFEQINRIITEKLFAPELVQKISTELVNPETEEVNRITLQKVYGESGPKRSVVYIWDAQRYFLKIPEEITMLQLAMEACLEELAPSRR